MRSYSLLRSLAAARSAWRESLGASSCPRGVIAKKSRSACRARTSRPRSPAIARQRPSSRRSAPPIHRSTLRRIATTKRLTGVSTRRSRRVTTQSSGSERPRAVIARRSEATRSTLPPAGSRIVRRVSVVSQRRTRRTLGSTSWINLRAELSRRTKRACSSSPSVLKCGCSASSARASSQWRSAYSRTRACDAADVMGGARSMAPWPHAHVSGSLMGPQASDVARAMAFRRRASAGAVPPLGGGDGRTSACAV